MLLVKSIWMMLELLVGLIRTAGLKNFFLCFSKQQRTNSAKHSFLTEPKSYLD